MKFKKKPRIFTFGCSFTNFIEWPTWAEILKKEYGDLYEFQNWGQEGACNYYIFNALMECNIKNQINKDDIVIIMWSTVNRESRYVNGKWITPGNVYNNKGVYPNEFVEQLADERGYALRDFSLVYSIDNFLSGIGCKYYFLSMLDLDTFQEKNKDLVKSYSKVLAKVRPSIYKVVFNEKWGNPPNILTNHPDLNKDQKQALKNEISRIEEEYNIMKGSAWPPFEDYWNDNVSQVDKSILQEIDFIKSQQDWDSVKGKYFRFDKHPYPKEHLEYIEKILPEFPISKSTSDWVDLIDKKILNCEKVNKYWINTTVKRW